MKAKRKTKSTSPRPTSERRLRLRVHQERRAPSRSLRPMAGTPATDGWEVMPLPTA